MCMGVQQRAQARYPELRDADVEGALRELQRGTVASNRSPPAGRRTRSGMSCSCMIRITQYRRCAFLLAREPGHGEPCPQAPQGLGGAGARAPDQAPARGDQDARCTHGRHEGCCSLVAFVYARYSSRKLILQRIRIKHKVWLDAITPSRRVVIMDKVVVKVHKGTVVPALVRGLGWVVVALCGGSGE